MSNALEQFRSDVNNEMKNAYSQLAGKTLVVWGIGNYGELLFQKFTEYGFADKIACFCDDRDEVRNTFFHGKEVLQVRDIIAKFPDAVYVIASSYYYIIRNNIPSDLKDKISIFEISDQQHEFESALATSKRNSNGQPIILLSEWFDIYEQLEKSNKLEEMIQKISKLLEDTRSKEVLSDRSHFFTTGKIDFVKHLVLSDPIYFDDEYMPFNNKNEVFFDVGGFDGDSAQGFIDFVGGVQKCSHFRTGFSKYPKVQREDRNEFMGECSNT